MLLSILDLFESPRESLQLSVLADRLGYSRYWIGEHHDASQCSNPLLLAALIAQTTRHIRVGTGAASVQLRNPVLLAEDAQLIEYLFPDRFDLGVAPALGSPEPIVAAIAEGRELSYGGYVRRLRQLYSYVSATLDPSSPVADAFHAEPGPPLWVIGRGFEAAQMAAELGVGFCASFHHGGTPAGLRETFQRYRESFKPSVLLTAPNAIVVMSGKCADADLIRPPSTSTGETSNRIEFSGVAEQAAETIRTLAEEVEADEAMVISLIARGPLELKAHMYAALARAWGLRPPEQRAT